MPEKDALALSGKWWIATGFAASGGERVLGPFVSRDLALRVRNFVEQNHARTYAVDDAFEVQVCACCGEPDVVGAGAKVYCPACIRGGHHRGDSLDA